uniref:La1-like protein 13 n=1 Tax=Urodacus yaschenkoi TaxID=1273102 RepID=LA1D_UROYA|nr:RecName: Full=La1-like protein 13; Flags: Precursor [Urodacus yaschenkoi]AGA82760.1 La1-like protein 13 precursor [Urodacus yaschenkoi]
MERILKPVFLAILIVLSFSSQCMGFGESCQAGKHIVPVGQQQIDSSTCTLYKCSNYNRKYALETTSCATLKMKSGCRMVPGAATAPFPNCCPMMMCKG